MLLLHSPHLTRPDRNKLSFGFLLLRLAFTILCGKRKSTLSASSFETITGTGMIIWCSGGAGSRDFAFFPGFLSPVMVWNCRYSPQYADSCNFSCTTAGCQRGEPFLFVI